MSIESVVGKLKRGAVGLSLCAVLGLGAISMPKVEANHKYTSAIVKADRQWNKGLKNKSISSYMKLPTTNAILGKSVQYVTFDPDTKKTNFDRLVYQRHLIKQNKKPKPVLVFFYHNRDPKTGRQEKWSQRSAIMFRRLAKEYNKKIRKLVKTYGKKIKFVGFNVDINPLHKKNKYNAFFNKYKINRIPSIQMYASKDVLKKCTYKGNRLIDTLRGGPTAKKWIPAWLKGPKSMEDWINSNILKPNKKYVIRLYNSGTPKKIYL